LYVFVRRFSNITLLFSATFSPEIKRLASAICRTRSRLKWPAQRTASTVEQHFYSVSADDKRRAANLKTRGMSRRLCLNSKLGCARLALIGA
jgi:superfamily II DNA/RNA helicase